MSDDGGTRAQPDEGFAKICFTDAEYPEWVWGEFITAEQYRLDSIPFFAFGVSWDDIIEVAPNDEGDLCFQRVVRKGGNRTIRVGLPEDAGDLEPLYGALKRLGCQLELLAQMRLLAVNIPAGADLKAIADFLTVQDQEWEYADPTYDELFGED